MAARTVATPLNEVVKRRNFGKKLTRATNKGAFKNLKIPTYNPPATASKNDSIDV
jgi:hypothetical protein